MSIVIDPECLVCTLCHGPVGDDYQLIRDGAGGVACHDCWLDELYRRIKTYWAEIRCLGC